MGCCEHSNELLGSIKVREFLDQLRDYLILKKDLDSWNWLIGWLVGWLVGSFIS
jgi:hypothetical protein